MTIYECGDAVETADAVRAATETEGPVYIRMLRGDIPRLFDEGAKFGNNRIISKGADITLVSSGICTEEALIAAEALKGKGLSITHIHVNKLKPFDGKELLQFAASSKYGVVTVENHSVIGGLGSIVSEIMAEAGLGKKIVKAGIKDCFLHGASKKYLLRECGLNAMSVIAQVEGLTGVKFGINESGLSEAFVPKVHSESKAEAL
jgi:transketolase